MPLELRSGLLLALLLAFGAQAQERQAQERKVSAVSPAEDPNLWLEEVEGKSALDWVRARNAQSQAVLEVDPGFAALREDLRAILDSEAKIPYVEKLAAHFYNFWQDAAHPRGIWRRTTPEEYRKEQPDWELLLDVDALNRAEGENWVWHGADCLKPAQPGQPYERCLISLSRGGADADVTREFDLAAKGFVEGGFFRPESKGGMGWIDRDTAYVFTDFGAGSMTESGYPRLVKQWQRGTPLDTAAVVYEGRAEDMYIAAFHDDTRGFERDFVNRTLAFYNDELYLRRRGGELLRIEVPNSANKRVIRQWLTVELREPWRAGGHEYPAGALLAIDFDAFLAGGRDFDVLFEPDAHTSLAGYGALKDHLYLNVLEDVKNRISLLTPAEHDGRTRWQREPLAGMPGSSTLGIQAIDDEESDDYFLTVTDFLTPTTLYQGAPDQPLETLKAMPAFFDAHDLRIGQHFATSADGTRVPYFLITRKDAAHNGDTPTLLYGYGGFEISLTPSYNAAVGRAWLSQGGAYAVANIRGGGEYGPRWHQAALKANRLRAYEDFAAVARDLIASKLASPAHLGIQGGSNGGLLMGNMTVLYPELFGAVVCQVPLLDMKRYHRLLAGASWMAEYGDPDKPGEWDFIRAFSPYQNVKAAAKYPPVLFMTSTRDDRVHPGHARKMMARMQAQGHDVLYYENIEGGHGGAADNAQRAHMQALAYTFLKRRLFPTE